MAAGPLKIAIVSTFRPKVNDGMDRIPCYDSDMSACVLDPEPTAVILPGGLLPGKALTWSVMGNGAEAIAWRCPLKCLNPSSLNGGKPGFDVKAIRCHAGCHRHSFVFPFHFLPTLSLPGALLTPGRRAFCVAVDGSTGGAERHGGVPPWKRP